MFKYQFEMAGNAATMVIFYTKEVDGLPVILLGKRKPTSDAYPNAWCLPGGYLETGKEQLVTTARRETLEECGIDISEEEWIHFYLDDKPGSDPRYKQVVNNCFFAELLPDENRIGKIKAGDDIVEVKWITLEEAFGMDLAFEHNSILEEFNSKWGYRRI